MGFLPALKPNWHKGRQPVCRNCCGRALDGGLAGCDGCGSLRHRRQRHPLSQSDATGPWRSINPVTAPLSPYPSIPRCGSTSAPPCRFNVEMDSSGNCLILAARGFPRCACSWCSPLIVILLGCSTPGPTPDITVTTASRASAEPENPPTATAVPAPTPIPSAALMSNAAAMSTAPPAPGPAPTLTPTAEPAAKPTVAPHPDSRPVAFSHAPAGHPIGVVCHSRAEDCTGFLFRAYGGSPNGRTWISGLIRMCRR